MVNPVIFIFSLLFLRATTVVGQTDIDVAARLINTADSVILISHVATQENHDKPDNLVLPLGMSNDTKPIEFSSFLVGEDINPAIIVQRRFLTNLDVVELAKIIQKHVKKSYIGSKPLCFEPHHAILIYKKGRFSYIDLCFHCSDLVTSFDLQLTNMDFINGKWEEMKVFFLKHGLSYEIGDNN